MAEKVLITGGAGYSGSVLTEELLKKGYQVTCLDTLKFRQNAIAIYASNPLFNFVYGDVRDERIVNKLVNQHDVIIPLAAVVGAPACDNSPIEAESVNREAIRIINDRRSSNQKLIFPNTTSAYGGELGRTFCDENTPFKPISLYGRTKIEARNLLLESAKPFVELRFSTMFGMSLRMRTDLMINDFVLHAVRDGAMVIFEKEFKRDYVHVRDVARVFNYSISNYDALKNEAFNVGLDEANLSKGELAERIKAHIPQFRIIYDEIGKDPDKRDYMVSNEKLKKRGFQYSVSLDEGIEELIRGYKIIIKTDNLKNI
jgi:nucleoside-diphosphate-sugar epimerase